MVPKTCSKKKKILTEIVSAAANILFLRPLAELAMVNTSQMMTNGTQNLLQKKKKFSTKIASAAANFLFLRPLAELAGGGGGGGGGFRGVNMMGLLFYGFLIEVLVSKLWEINI